MKLLQSPTHQHFKKIKFRFRLKDATVFKKNKDVSKKTFLILFIARINDLLPQTETERLKRFIIKTKI